MITLDPDVLIDVTDRPEPSFSVVADLFERGQGMGTASIHAAEVLRGTSPRS